MSDCSPSALARTHSQQQQQQAAESAAAVRETAPSLRIRGGGGLPTPGDRPTPDPLGLGWAEANLGGVIAFMGT